MWLNTYKYTISSACRFQHHRVSNAHTKHTTTHFCSGQCNFVWVPTCSCECHINPAHLYFSESALCNFSWQDANTNYLFTFGTPGRGYFFGARVNPVNSDYLDMRLEGDAAGWVAIGFTNTSSMVGVSIMKLSSLICTPSLFSAWYSTGREWCHWVQTRPNYWSSDSTGLMESPEWSTGRTYT